jgi:hypothetical protein
MRHLVFVGSTYVKNFKPEALNFQYVVQFLCVRIGGEDVLHSTTVEDYVNNYYLVRINFSSSTVLT